jgi:hypothetical protein
MKRRGTKRKEIEIEVCCYECMDRGGVFNYLLVGPLSVARDMNAGDVANFLAKIGLHQYSEEFVENDISGDSLFGMKENDLSDVVNSPLHQMKIVQLFHREMEGIEAKYSNDHLSAFLLGKKLLKKYIPFLKEHGIDGDMILRVEEEFMKTVLEEIGVDNKIQRGSIISQYKTFISKL